MYGQNNSVMRHFNSVTFVSKFCWRLWVVCCLRFRFIIIRKKIINITKTSRNININAKNWESIKIKKSKKKPFFFVWLRFVSKNDTFHKGNLSASGWTSVTRMKCCKWLVCIFFFFLVNFQLNKLLVFQNGKNF